MSTLLVYAYNNHMLMIQDFQAPKAMLKVSLNASFSIDQRLACTIRENRREARCREWGHPGGRKQAM